MKRHKGMKKSSGRHEGGTGIMPAQFAGKKPSVEYGKGSKAKSKGRMAREKRLEGKAL